MRSVGRLDSPSSLRHDHSTRARSKDFAHELIKTDDEHTREAIDRRQDASASGSSEKAQADGAKVSVPVVDGVGNNHASSPRPTVAHASSMLGVEALPNSTQILATSGNPISTLATTALATGDKTLIAPAPTIAGEEKIPDASGPKSAGTSVIPEKNVNQQLVVNETGTSSQQVAAIDSNEIKSPALSLYGDDRGAGLNTSEAESGEVVQPTGITEALIGSRIYGEHLLAEPYLSELVESPSMTLAQGKDMTSSVGAVRSAAISVVETDPSSVEKGEELTAPQQEEIMAALTSLADGNESVSIGSSRTIGALSAAAAEASTAFWPESSVRLTKQRDGSAVIWLRDYRANGDDASKLVDAMVKGANAKGMRLGRIVLNGREVWTSRNNH